MEELTRIGVAIGSDLLARFDRFIAKQGYTNRSEALRDLMRDRLVSGAVGDPETPVVGTVTLIYDHHARLLPDKLMTLQHDHHELIISTTHAHLDHHTCLEVVVVKGGSKRVQKLADLLIGAKGVQHGRLVMSSPFRLQFPHRAHILGSSCRFAVRTFLNGDEKGTRCESGTAPQR